MGGQNGFARSREEGVWLVGERGLLGRQLATEMGKCGLAFWASDKEVDISSPEQLDAFARGKSIRWIVNCAAYTAVDRAETEKAEAFRVNAQGAGNLAGLCRRIGARLIHFSSDYVFSGRQERAYRESSRPRPQNTYGCSKLEGEKRIRATRALHFIFRVSWLYGIHGSNFVQTMLKVFRESGHAQVVDDQVGSPTYAAELAGNIVRLLGSGSTEYGLYHYADEGRVSWYEFACAIAQKACQRGIVTRPVHVQAVHSAAFLRPAARPAFSLLETSKVRGKLGFCVYPWQDNLEKYFDELQEREGGRS